MILTEVPLTEVPLTPIPNFPVLSIGAPASASIAPQRTHFKFLITSPQMACYARLYFLTIPP